MTSVQLTSDQFLNAVVKVPEDIIDGKNNLDFLVKVELQMEYLKWNGYQICFFKTCGIKVKL